MGFPDEQGDARTRAWAKVDDRADQIAALLTGAAIAMDETTAAALAILIGGYFVGDVDLELLDLDDIDVAPDATH